MLSPDTSRVALTYPSDFPTQVACLVFGQNAYTHLDACRQQRRDEGVSGERWPCEAVDPMSDPNTNATTNGSCKKLTIGVDPMYAGKVSVE